MTATAHALVAGAIAAHFAGDPVLAIAIALTSHFIMDAVPHWDIGTNWRSRSKATTGAFAIADTILGITVTYFLFASKVAVLPLGACILASLLPDWMETPWYIFFVHSNTKREPAKNAGFWEKFTYGIYKTENMFHAKAQFPLGAITQLITVAFFLLILR